MTGNPNINQFEVTPNSIDLNDISWVMQSIDIESVLDRLGVRISERRGDQIWGFCPDHELFVGKEPSHPKWTINITTGQTNCFTESRGSNIVYVASRLRRTSVLQALEWIMGVSVNSIEAKYSRIKRLIIGYEPIKEVNAFNMNDFFKYIEEGELQSDSISLLCKDGILPKTARDFSCVEFVEGFYKNRLVFPVKDIDGKLVGFIATDVLGLENWLKEHPKIVDPETKELRNSNKDDYRKVRYPYGFKISKYLIGADKFKKNDIAILVEGKRDVMKLHQEGFSGALGLGGTSLSDNQLVSLAKLHPKKIIVMLDGDNGGRSSENKVANKCLDVLDEVFISRVTWGFDPKDFSREEILFFMRNKTSTLYKNKKTHYIGELYEK